MEILVQNTPRAFNLTFYKFLQARVEACVIVNAILDTILTSIEIEKIVFLKKDRSVKDSVLSLRKYYVIQQK